MSIKRYVRGLFNLCPEVNPTPTCLKGYHTDTRTRFGRHPAVFLKLARKLKKLSQII